MPTQPTPLDEAMKVAAVEDALEGRDRTPARFIRPIHARTIIDALAKGVDPITNQSFDSDHVLNQPEIIRALVEAARVMEQVHRREEVAAEQMKMQKAMAIDARQWPDIEMKGLQELERMNPLTFEDARKRLGL